MSTLDGSKIESNDLLTNVERECFKKMFFHHGKAFAFESHNIRSVNASVVALLAIFTISHTLWNLRPILILKDSFTKTNEKIKMEILKPCITPYSNRGSQYLRRIEC